MAGSPSFAKRLSQYLRYHCSLRKLFCFLVGALIATVILVHAYKYFVESTYYWQVTHFADFLRPVHRTTCTLSPQYNSTTLTTQSISSHKSKYNIAVVSMYADSDRNWEENLMRRVIENRLSYCARYGYTFINGNRFIDASKPVAWSKVLAVKALLMDYDYVLYMDMDAVIMRGDLPLETFISAAPSSAHFLMTEDWSGPNTGIWLARNTTFATWFLDMVFRQHQLVPATSLRGMKHPFEYEQRAFHFLLNTRVWRERALPAYQGDFATNMTLYFYFFPQCAFNSYIVHPFEFRANRQMSQVHGSFIDVHWMMCLNQGAYLVCGWRFHCAFCGEEGPDKDQLNERLPRRRWN